MSEMENSLNNFRTQLQAERQLRESQAEEFGNELAGFEQELDERRQAPASPACLDQEETLMPDMLKAAAVPPPHSDADEQKDEDELPPLEDLPEPELLKAAAPPQQERRAEGASSKEMPRALPTPQANSQLAAPSEQRFSPPALDASGTLQVPKTPVRDRRSAEEVLTDAGVALEPEALFRALITPSSKNVTCKQVNYPATAPLPEAEEEDPAAVQDEQHASMAKMLTNRLKLNHQAEQAPEEDAVSPEMMRKYEEELQVHQEAAMKNSLHTIFKALS